MVQQANTIAVVKNTRATIDGVDYELHIPSIKFDKAQPKPVTWQGGTPEAQYAGATPEQDHVAKIKVGHDYQNDESAYAFFRAHPGEQVTLEWWPDALGIYSVTTTITIVSPNPGGDYGKHHDSEPVMPCTPPVDHYAAAAAPVILAHVSDGTLGIAGGEELYLEGTGFATATAVKFAGASVPFKYLGVGRILVDAVPAHAAGVVAITVVNPTGTSAGHNVTYA